MWFRGERILQRTSRWLPFLGLLLLTVDCQPESSCDQACQEKLFHCFRLPKTCVDLCPSGRSIGASCAILPTLPLTTFGKVTISQEDCGRCHAAFDAWQAGKDCEEGQARCQQAITQRKVVGLLLQKCVLVGGRRIWSEGRVCLDSDGPPCFPTQLGAACLGCEKDGECPTSFVCDTAKKRCIQCAFDDDCPKQKSDTTCQDGVCTPCQRNDDCRPRFSGHICSSNQCVCFQDQQCQAYGFARCEKNQCVACQQDSDCASGQKCISSRCTKDCQRDFDCLGLREHVCAGGRCRVACQSDAECNLIKLRYCENRRCIACRDASECPNGLRCDRGYCLP
ncbi:MAG: hypothetical protein H6728_09040 [Myxococcales bacterium]|nr:hypothetical protein [Myxococcales bacterium]